MGAPTSTETALTFDPELLSQTWQGSELAKLKKYLAYKTFEPGETIFGKGETGQYMAFVVSGNIDIFIDETLLGVIEPGQLLGEMAIFMKGYRRTAMARAKDQVSILKLERSDIDTLIETDLKLAMKILYRIGQTLATRLFDNDATLSKSYDDFISGDHFDDDKPEY
jgi:CRP-like cAMP-binding protein